MKLYSFQEIGVEWLASRTFGHLGDDMGLGKTGQAIRASDDVGDRLTLVVCPASLKLNWVREINQWQTNKRPVTMIVGTEKRNLVGVRRAWVVINYDILEAHREMLHATPWDTIICDEAHYLKNKDSKRTQMLLGKSSKQVGGPLPRLTAARRWTLSGTPILNRPGELWTLWYWLDPLHCPSYWDYMREHAGATQANGWDCSGAAGLDALRMKVKPWLLRRKKSEVLKELPAKTRQILEIEPDEEGKQLLTKQHKIINTEAEFREKFSQLRPGYPDWENISLLRHETARAKVRSAMDHIYALLQETDKIVVFAYHRDVIEKLAALPGASCIHGDVSMPLRAQRIQDFQTKPEPRILVCQMTAAGVGINLTAASTVVFVEESWVPGEISQAEDRCHRIGQRENVLVQHLVLADSLDAYMARMIVEKQEIIDRILD